MFRRLLALIVIAVGLAIAGTAGSAAAATGNPPMGLMIQVSSLQTTPAATLRGWLEDIRRDHHDSARSGYINSVVLQDIADPSGALYTKTLGTIAPYLPGGTTPAFAKVYIGTVDLPWVGSGSKYIEGIENAAFRAQNITVSTKAARAFKTRYPQLTSMDWYITYEANLAGFWDSSIETAYRSYISSLMTSLSAIRANRTFLWSPAFWTQYADEPQWAAPGLQADFTDLFAGLPQPLIMDLQDFVGQSDGASTPVSAVQWINHLKQGWSSTLAKIELNVEQFTETNGVIAPGDPAEIAARETFYHATNVVLGPAWEIRYWHERFYGS